MSEQNIIELRKAQQKRIELQELRRDDFIGALGVWGPIAIPLIPASLTAIAISTHYPDLLGINSWVAVGLGMIAAGGIEVLGIVSTETFLQMRSYNQMSSEEEEQAPTVAAGIVAGCYLFVVMALVVLLKVWPDWAIYSLLPLTLLGALVSWIVVMRKQHSTRELTQLQKRMEADEAGKVQAKIEAMQNANEELQNRLDSAMEERDKLQNDLQNLYAEIAKGKLKSETATGKTQGVAENERPPIAELNAAKAEQIAERQRAILQLAEAYGAFSVAELRSRLQEDRGIEASERTLRTDLDALCEAGDLVKQGRGRWDIARSIEQIPQPAMVSANGATHGL